MYPEELLEVPRRLLGSIWYHIPRPDRPHCVYRIVDITEDNSAVVAQEVTSSEPPPTQEGVKIQLRDLREDRWSGIWHVAYARDLLSWTRQGTDLRMTLDGFGDESEANSKVLLVNWRTCTVSLDESGRFFERARCPPEMNLFHFWRTWTPRHNHGPRGFSDPCVRCQKTIWVRPDPWGPEQHSEPLCACTAEELAQHKKECWTREVKDLEKIWCIGPGASGTSHT